MYRYKIQIIAFFVFFLFVADLSGQIPWLTATERENHYDSIKTFRNYYVDMSPDTLVFENNIYFFRQTPLSLRNNYTNIFHKNEVILDDNILPFPNYDRTGSKGYTITWIVRNDSLYIKKIYPDYFYVYTVKDSLLQQNEDGSFMMEPNGGYIHEDTVTYRLEKFTGNKFQNNLLYVDWITGDFGVITSYIKLKPLDHDTKHYRDGREDGFIMTFKKGKFVKMKKDKREFKN
jgi:hypothetical protein